MNGVKSVLESKTIWGGIVALAAGGLGVLHYSITPADQASLVGLLTSLATGVGSALAIYGRVVASKKIG